MASNPRYLLDDEKFEPRQLVRTYSDKLKAEMDSQDLSPRLLSTAIVQEVQRQDEQALVEAKRQATERLSSNRRTLLLKKQCEELCAARDRFLKTLPEAQRARLARVPNTYEAIMDIVENSTTDWTEHRVQQGGPIGKFKTMFHKCCQTLDNHSTALEMIPAGNEHAETPKEKSMDDIRLMVQKASTNHQKLAEGLPKILMEIDRVVSAVQKEASLYRDRTEVIESCMVQLYSCIFGLFTKIIDWCASKSVSRAWKSLKRDCYQEFEDDLAEIKELSQWIQRDMQANSSRELHEVTRQMKYILPVLETFGTEREHRIRNQAAEEERIRLAKMLEDPESILQQLSEKLTSRLIQAVQSLGTNGTGLLLQLAETETARKQLAGPPSMTNSNEPSNQTKETRSIPTGVNSPKKDKQTREQIQLHSVHLEDWYSEGQVMLPASNFLDYTPSLPERLAESLHQWVVEPRSRILCYQASNPVDGLSSSTILAAEYTSIIASSNLPLLSFFCSLPRGSGVAKARIPETVALCELTAALIRQLISILPAELPNDSPYFGKERFEDLDGTLRTWDKMTEVLRDLLKVAPPVLFCVIDGLQWLDNEHTYFKIAQLVGILRGQMDVVGASTGHRRVLKVLFTTTGQARCLIPLLRRGELEVDLGLGAGRPAGGRKSMSPPPLTRSPS